MWGGRNKRDQLHRGGYSSSGPKDKSKYTPLDWAYEVIGEIRRCDFNLPVGHSIYDVFPTISGTTERIIDLEVNVCVDYGCSYNPSSVRSAVEIAIRSANCPYRVRYTLERI